MKYHPTTKHHLALSVVLIGNAGVVFVGWPATGGFLLREGRKRGRRPAAFPAAGWTVPPGLRQRRPEDARSCARWPG